MYKKHDNNLMWLSVAATVTAGYDFLAHTNVFGLAGTQWILIAIVLGVYAIYLKLRAA